VVVGLARLTLSESVRWLVVKGRVAEAESIVRRFAGVGGSLKLKLPLEQSIGLGEALSRYPFRLLVLAVVIVAQYVAYG
jgi:hypothetical protein